MGGRFHCKHEPCDKTSHISLNENNTKAGLLLNSLSGVRSRARTTVITAKPAQEGAVGPFPIHLHGAKRGPVLQLREEMLATTPGSTQSAEELLHQGKGKGGSGEVLFQQLSQCKLPWVWSMAFSF